MEGCQSGLSCIFAKDVSPLNGSEGSNPSPSANFRKGFRNQKYGRREAPSVLNSPQKILILQGFATLRVAQKVRFDP